MVSVGVTVYQWYVAFVLSFICATPLHFLVPSLEAVLAACVLIAIVCVWLVLACALRGPCAGPCSIPSPTGTSPAHMHYIFLM
jgi:hypothetical protein